MLSEGNLNSKYMAQIKYMDANNSNGVCMLSHVRLFANPWTVTHQAPLSMKFSSQNYWRRLPLPTPGDLPDPGKEPVSFTSPTLAGRVFTTSTTWDASSGEVLVYLSVVLGHYTPRH